MMKSFVRSAAVMVLLGATAACSMFGDKTPAPTSGTIEENVATVTAKVTAVDYDSRLVTIMTNEGESVTFKAGPEVKNLAQVDPGDVIRAQYYESVVYELKKPGEAVPGVQVAEEGAAAVGDGCDVLISDVTAQLDQATELNMMLRAEGVAPKSIALYRNDNEASVTASVALDPTLRLSAPVKELTLHRALGELLLTGAAGEASAA